MAKPFETAFGHLVDERRRDGRPAHLDGLSVRVRHPGGGRYLTGSQAGPTAGAGLGKPVPEWGRLRIAVTHRSPGSRSGRSGPGFDEAGGQGGANGGGPCPHAELGQDAGDVRLDGAHADEERLGDRPVGVTGDEQAKDF